MLWVSESNDNEAAVCFASKLLGFHCETAVPRLRRRLGRAVTRLRWYDSWRNEDRDFDVLFLFLDGLK